VKVIWTPEAERDRDAIWAFIAGDSLEAAARLDAVFSEAAMRLVEFPRLGADGLVASTRDLIPHASYRLVYEVRNETVWILALVHTARRWPPLPDEATD